jgi:diguanylate cyclase
MLNLINELFINATILVAFITFGNLFFREKGVNRLSPVAERILIGFMSGILGCILMLYSVRVTPKFILDFRYLPIIITALYISPVSAMITALIIGIFRVSYFGLSQSSIIGFFISLLVGVGCSIIGRLSLKSWLKWIYCNLYVYIVVGSSFGFLLGFSPMYYQVLIVYCLGTALISVGMFYFIEYLDSSNQHYRKIREESKKDFLTGL